MFSALGIILFLGIIAYVVGKENPLAEANDHRQARIFPFHTIGRFTNDPCPASNGLVGTCVLQGECRDNSGIPSGACPTSTQTPVNAATCCVYQMGCGSESAQNNTYFSNRNYPNSYGGGGTCSYKITKCAESICQLRVDFLVMDLAPPDGNGKCLNDIFMAEGVPPICGFNSGQHVYVNFGESADLTIAIKTSSNFQFGRRWHLQVTQIDCGSPVRAPDGCLQYYLDDSGVVSSFNYQSSATASLNSLEVPGSRQLASQQYGICVRAGEGMCSIQWSRPPNNPYAFTLTNDVQGVLVSLLGSEVVASQTCTAGEVQLAPCTTDYVVIPDAKRNGQQCLYDRFCSLGLPADIVSNVKPFVLYVVTDENEDPDIGNRGFSLAYTQQGCDAAA